MSAICPCRTTLQVRATCRASWALDHGSARAASPNAARCGVHERHSLLLPGSQRLPRCDSGKQALTRRRPRVIQALLWQTFWRAACGSGCTRSWLRALARTGQVPPDQAGAARSPQPARHARREGADCSSGHWIACLPCHRVSVEAAAFTHSLHSEAAPCRFSRRWGRGRRIQREARQNPEERERTCRGAGTRRAKCVLSAEEGFLCTQRAILSWAQVAGRHGGHERLPCASSERPRAKGRRSPRRHSTR